MEKEKLVGGILCLLSHNALSGDGSGYTLLEIMKFFEINKINDFSEKEGFKELKNLLREMESRYLIEERHFGEVLNGRVDYSIENKGTDLIHKKEKELKSIWDIDI